MSPKSSSRLLSVLLIVAASVLTMDIAGPSFVSPANASAVSDWKNSGVTAVAVGREHTCAIETGVLYCWGAGTNGQLGYAPVRVGFTIPPPTDQSKAIKVASAPGLGFTNTNVTATRPPSGPPAPSRVAACSAGVPTPLGSWGTVGWRLSATPR